MPFEKRKLAIKGPTRQLHELCLILMTPVRTKRCLSTKPKKGSIPFDPLSINSSVPDAIIHYAFYSIYYVQETQRNKGQKGEAIP
jgi:hypothetical protein